MLISKSFAVSSVPAVMMYYGALITITSDADPCKDQDGGKRNFIGGMTAELWVIFHLVKYGKMYIKKFKPC